MYSLLLIIIYIAFISLGLPDSLLGSAWPVMYKDFGVSLSYAGVVTMIIAGGTIISSLLSNRLTKTFGAGRVTAFSVMMTATALFGFSISDSFWMICLFAIPYGLGAGAVDAALNHYVALHYASRHMSWLHSFWGVGAAISPYIMSYFLVGGKGWQMGYRSVGFIQIFLTAALFISLPLWKKTSPDSADVSGKIVTKSFAQVLAIRGVVLVLISFFGYCALESTAGIWASSYLVRHRGIDAETAARFASLFFMGITFGRFASGFVSERLGDKWLIRIGIFVLSGGIIMVALPIQTDLPALMGLVVIGLGCAPIYPSIIHATPYSFGRENSQAIIGIQMASAYTGTTLMPPIFGLIADYVNIGLFPLYLAVFAILMLVMTERATRVIERKKRSDEADTI